MTPTTILDFVTLFCAGLLAGALVVIDYAVGPAILAVADAATQIQMRQALIKTLRVLVPIFFGLTILTGLTITVLNGADAGFIARCAAVVAVFACFGLTLAGTAPINEAIGGWQPSAPPENWRAQISRWERLNALRTWIGVGAFVLFLIATALKLVAL